MSVNAQRSGVWTPEWTPENRIPALCEAIAAQRAHLVGFQEVGEWAKHGGQLLHEVEERLGLVAVPGSFLADRSTGLMYDPEVMELQGWEPAAGSDPGRQGFGGTARFDLGLPYSVAVVVVHLSHQSAPLALHQASLVNDRARRVADRHQPPGALRAEAALVFGDINQPPLYHSAGPPDPRPEQVPAANVAYRFTGALGEEIVNRDVAELFARCRWSDLARQLADQSIDRAEQARLLAPTGVHGGFAVDRVYASESVAPALSRLHHLTVPSDHRALVWDLAPARVDPSLTTCLHA